MANTNKGRNNGKSTNGQKVKSNANNANATKRNPVPMKEKETIGKTPVNRKNGNR